MSKDSLYFPAMNRSFTVVDVNLDEWCERWELEVFIGTCGGCGAEQIVNVPWYGDGVRGLRADKCECGHEYYPFSVIHLDPHHSLNKYMF